MRSVPRHFGLRPVSGFGFPLRPLCPHQELVAAPWERLGLLATLLGET